MKNLTLTVKIWLAISLVSLFLYLLVFLLMPTFIHKYFTDTLMEPHGASKRNIATEPLPSYLKLRGLTVRSFIILEDGSTLPANAGKVFSASLLQEIKQNAESQQSSKGLYESTEDQAHIRYAIRKDTVYGHPLYQVTFLQKSEEEHFVSTFLYNIMPYVGIALVISWFASLLLVRYLTRPLVQMQQHVKHIANRNWHEPLAVKRGDEIGQLAASIETMRQQLVQQDEAQQSMLQNISHELKTPVMVIRSYAQAMQDGVYPKGDLAGSIQVIDEEGERLEKLVKQLLYLTRLDYLSTRNPVQEKVHLDKLIEKIVQRMHLQRPEINWQSELQPVTVEGDVDTLRVMIENLLDNHLRHAVSRLEIALQADSEKSAMVLTIWNDGSKIEPHVLQQIYQPFQKGREGKFGLGLTIVQRILKIYQGHITLENERNGVSSKIQIPLKNM